MKKIMENTCSYRNRPRLDTDIVVKIGNYEIRGLDKGPEPGARWILTFDGASNTLGHDIWAVLTSPKNAHNPYTKLTSNGILNIQK